MNIPATQQQQLPKAPFPAGRTYPAVRRKQASSTLSFLPDNQRLELLVPAPSGEVLKQFCQGTLHMALVRRGAATVLLHRFGGQPWRVAVCDGEGLGDGRRRVYRALARQRSSPFQFSAGIVDPNSGAVLAVRHATLSPLFASLIGKAMKATDSKAEDPAAQAADLDWLMVQHPGDLLGLASIYERAVSPPAAAGSTGGKPAGR